MILLDGRKLASEIKTELAEEVSNLDESSRAPHLVAVLIGDSPASLSYVSSKVKSCDQVGFKSTLIRESSDITQENLLKLVEDLNADDDVDGFIVQLPLPKHIDEDEITLAIDPKKDVDGFHPLNFGRMALGLPSYIPATPMGILEMIKRYNVETSGKRAVVVGRSNIVGRPISILLSQKLATGNCTVSVVHSRSQNMKEELKQADIVVAAIGIPHFITEDMLKPGATVIDVGINRVEDASRKRGYRLVGDVDFENVSEKCSHITPVPGGVGPMTVTALLMNTFKAFKKEVYS